MDPLPLQIIQLVFFDGTSQSILSPIMKKPVPPHHLHSVCPFELQDEQTIGRGCWEINQVFSMRLTKSDESTKEARILVNSFSLRGIETLKPIGALNLLLLPCNVFVMSADSVLLQDAEVAIFVFLLLG